MTGVDVENIRDKIRTDIAKFLADYEREQRFEDAFKIIKGFFQSYMVSFEGRTLLYRVAGRDDYQNGKALKTEASIVEKIIDKREKEDPTYSVEKLRDIIGLRLICAYPSDCIQILSYINKAKDILTIEPPEQVAKRPKNKDEPWYEAYRVENKETGYRAYHAIASLTDYRYRDLHCEIQIVTMLQEAWSFKTHDLVYKSEEVEKKYQAHTKHLSDLLESIDFSSELVKSQIKEKSKAEEEYRKFLIVKHALHRLSDTDEELDQSLLRCCDLAKGIDFTEINDPQDGLKLLKYLVRQKIEGQKEENVASEKDTSKFILGEVDRYEAKWKVFEQKGFYEICRDLSRIVCLAAANDSSGEFWPLAWTCADNVIAQCQGEAENLADAYLHKATVMHACKRLRDAAFCAEQTINRTKDTKLAASAKNGWVYYVTEMVDEDLKRVKSRFSEAQKKEWGETCSKYISDAINAPDEEVREASIDTDGYFRLVFGSTLQQIHEGLTRCAKVYFADPNNTVKQLYYKRHLQRALERSLEIQIAGPEH